VNEILVAGSAVEMVACRLFVETRLMNLANYSLAVSVEGIAYLELTRQEAILNPRFQILYELVFNCHTIIMNEMFSNLLVLQQCAGSIADPMFDVNSKIPRRRKVPFSDHQHNTPGVNVRPVTRQASNFIASTECASKHLF